MSVRLGVWVSEHPCKTRQTRRRATRGLAARYGVYRLKSYGYSQYLYANCTLA
ncbi:hypothetical protein ACGF7W_25345 [Streptomyces sp. NPDC048219]|uniref:hypothetical protein n=1 Tax=Streptomyces sp. NPDC048219 TaxID=3365517 RepID=UPI00371DA651